MTAANRRTCIILVNWNGWQDTQRCLESLFLGSEQAFTVMVCDNASEDDSLRHLSEWARTNRIDFHFGPSADLNDDNSHLANCRLLLIQTGSNLGFAAACNIGLRYVIKTEHYSHAWLLNNDTVVDTDCLATLLQASQNDEFDRPVGSEIYNLAGDRKLQVYGGQKLGVGPLISPRHCDTSSEIDYLVGASIFLTRERLIDLGLLDERFFLNAEDLAYTLGYKRDFTAQHPDVEPFIIAGKIWHEESSTQGRDRFLHAYYYSRNVLLIARDEGAASLLVTGLHAMLRILKATCLFRLSAARGIATGIWHAIQGREGIYLNKVD